MANLKFGILQSIETVSLEFQSHVNVVQFKVRVVNNIWKLTHEFCFPQTMILLTEAYLYCVFQVHGLSNGT